MKTAILFTSRHGTTAAVADTIADLLRSPGEVDIIDLKKERDPDLDAYDTVILGTSIHMGNPAKTMQRYVTETRHKNALESKRVGLFICCMYPDQARRTEQLEHAFPEYLHRHAAAEFIAGGEFRTERMTRLERMVVKKVSGSSGPFSAIDTEAVKDFAEKMKA